MKCIHLVGAAFAAVVAVSLISAPAFAGPTYTYSVSTGAQPSTVGTITLAQGDTVSPVPAACSNPEDCVTIDLKFISGIYGILNSGSHIPFGFELASAVSGETLSIGWIDPTGGSYTNTFGNSGTFSLHTNFTTPHGQPGFGSFDAWLTNSAGNGSSKAYYGELKFVLECTANCGTTGLDTNDFIQNGSHVYFTADTTNGSNTGAQAWETRVPEPSTILLFGTALAGFGLYRRRRHSKAA